jgi:hypothetical protein
MMSGHRGHEVGVGIIGLLLVVSACTSDSAETTTTSSTTTSTSTSSTTTTTVPLATNGPGIAFEGDVNATVEALQFLIDCNGYAELSADGIFGPATRAAVQDTQNALGREATGVPDEATFATLSRGCDEGRRIEIGEDDGGGRIVVGNAAASDSEIFFIRVEEGLRLTVIVESDSGDAVASVRRTDGSTFGVAGVTAWAEDVDTTGDYVIEVSTTGEPVTFRSIVAQAEVEIDLPDPPSDGMVEVGDLSEEVTSVCVDTAGVSSFVAETGPGYLVVTTDTVGDFALDRGGIGAPIEFLFKDDSGGYVGFGLDFDIEVGDQIQGSGVVFVPGGDPAAPVGLSFAFDRSAAPCEGGGSGTSIVLTKEGLGVVDFGADDDETLDFVRSALPSAAPPIDTGWIPIDAGNNEYGVCRDGTTEVRVVEIDNLTLYFTSAGTSFASAGTRHFVAFTADEGVFPFVTTGGVGAGSTLGEILAAHPDAVAVDGGDGVDVFIASPPGDDRWLRATTVDATGPDDLGATIATVIGGRFCGV